MHQRGSIVVLPLTLLSVHFSLMLRLAFFALFALPLFASAQSKVLTDEGRRFAAMTSRDTAALRGMLHDDLIYIHSNNLTENKAQHIAAIGSGRLVYKEMTSESVNLRRYGKTALTNGTVQVKGILNGTPFEVRLAYTAVYRKKRGHWRLLNWQSTRIP